MPRDLVISAGRVFDGTAMHPHATAVAISGGTIVAVGSDAEAAAAVGSSAEHLDARGGLIAPAFLDAHVHPLQGGRERLTCDLTDCVDAADTLRRIGDYARSHPDDEWIVGGGWHMAHFAGGLPRADDLERVAPGRRIYLVNADHHGAWVSPSALAAAGIDSRTPDPADGRIDRDSAGVPTGTLQEGAMDLLGHLLPIPGAEAWVEALLEAQRYLHGFGVTGWHDAIVGSYAGVPDSTDAYLTSVESGALRARVTGALWLPRGFEAAEIGDVVDRLVAARDRIGTRRNDVGGGFRATSIKIMQDGVPESLTAGMKAPYLDACGHPTAELGTSHFAPDVLDAVAVELVRAGFQLHIHAIGDRAVAEAIAALRGAGAGAASSADLRHHIAHLQQVDPADIGSFAQLGVTANLQALWACRDDQMVELNLPLVGEERFERQYPFASMAAAGIPLAMGSDWPVSTPDPWQAISVAVVRRPPGERGVRPLGSGEELSLTQALAAATSGSARIMFADDAGRIEVGARADIAVSDRNPFELEADELHAVSTSATVSFGEVVHSV